MLEKRIESGTIEEHQLNPDQQLWDRTEPTAATPTVSLKDGWSLYAKNYDDRLNLIEDYIVLLSGNVNVYSETRTRMVYINNTSNTYYLTFVNGGTAYPVNPAETVKCWWDGSAWRTDHTFNVRITADGSANITMINPTIYKINYFLDYTRASSSDRTFTLQTSFTSLDVNVHVKVKGTGTKNLSLAGSTTVNGLSATGWVWYGTGEIYIRWNGSAYETTCDTVFDRTYTDSSKQVVTRYTNKEYKYEVFKTYSFSNVSELLTTYNYPFVNPVKIKSGNTSAGIVVNISWIHGILSFNGFTSVTIRLTSEGAIINGTSNPVGLEVNGEWF